MRNCSKLLMTFNKCLTRMVKIVSKKKYNATYSIINAKRESKKVKKEVCKLENVDVIFAELRVVALHIQSLIFQLFT